MGFIRQIIEKQRQVILKRNADCEQLIFWIDAAIRDAKRIVSARQTFIDPNAAYEWKNVHGKTLLEAKSQNIQKFKKAEKYRQLCAMQETLFAEARALPQRISKHNDYVAQKKAVETYNLIGTVEGKKLDQQQLNCIAKEAHNHLVIAGAGTGKTTTVVGKVKYLLKSGKCLPQDILVLSFTNASAAEMKERIVAETGVDIAASTFHKLGLNIISRVDGVMPKITKINLRKFIKEQIEGNMRSESYLRLLSSYLVYHRVMAKSEFEFASQKEYHEYLKQNPPTTLQNETVKSYGELDIANFLTQNGIRYIYEHPYQVDTRTEEYGQYYPDFFLPDYGIYIEYFGINRKGEVPPYFKAENGMSAGEAYRAAMEWKRKVHRENRTTMLECYAYEKIEGTLIDALKKKLEANAVILTPKSAEELWMQIANEEASLIEGIVELFETLISLIKSNNYTIAMLRTLNRTSESYAANEILLSLLEPIFSAYEQYLLGHGEIDFSDMINKAASYVKAGRYVNSYKYVIVDEYQDISKARFTLLESLRQSNYYDLFCVGDDWQSIYRFAGSDIGYILNFSRYWGATEVSKIETTYRFSQKLIEISGEFVMKNPAQIKKSIRGRADEIVFPLGEISGYTEKFAIEFMEKKLDDIPKESSIFFIGRYSFDVKLLEDSGLFSCKYNNETGLYDVKSKRHPFLKMEFMTAHKSKGLQADYVFIINNKCSKMGFPSKIQDAPILDLLLDNCDKHPYAEERRLFYVALTRAKKKVYILTVKGKESVFTKELKVQYEEELRKEPFTCPLCGGRLIKRSGKFGEFWGCSGYPNCRYIRNIR